jgi:hypothetical protein
LECYLAAGDLCKSLPCSALQSAHFGHLSELTLADIAAIDSAGERGARHDAFIKTVHVMAVLMLFGAAIFRIYAFVAKT